MNPSTHDVIPVALDQAHTRQTAAGTARYSRGLAGALRRRSDVELFELAAGEVQRRVPVRKQLLTLRQDFVWYPWLGRRTARMCGAEVYHCPTSRGPLTRGGLPLVVTVHDLVPIRLPDTMTPWSRWYGKFSLPRVLAAADILIVPSNDTADDLRRLMHVEYDRIRVVPNGVDELFFTPTATSRPVNYPYVLFVGTPEPRKNLRRLQRAMEVLRSRGRGERLVVAGGTGWGEVALDSRYTEWVGRIDDQELRRFYAHSACLALPSLHEGFGLPAVEAMAVGTPVVAARSGALPEVTGGAAVLVDPTDVDDIAAGIEEAISKKVSLIEKGRARAGAFTWEAAAEATVKVYREVA